MVEFPSRASLHEQESPHVHDEFFKVVSEPELSSSPAKESYDIAEHCIMLQSLPVSSKQRLREKTGRWQLVHRVGCFAILHQLIVIYLIILDSASAPDLRFFPNLVEVLPQRA